MSRFAWRGSAAGPIIGALRPDDLVGAIVKPTWYDIPGPTPGRLSTMARPRGDDWLDDEMAALRAAGVDVLVSLQTATEQHEVGLTGEDAAARRAGLTFRHLPTVDLGVPTRREVIPLVREILADLAAGRHVVVHCRAGIGRSSLIAGAVLVALGAKPAEAWQTIGAARGHHVPETPNQGAWLDAWPAAWADHSAGPH